MRGLQQRSPSARAAAAQFLSQIDRALVEPRLLQAVRSAVEVEQVPLIATALRRVLNSWTRPQKAPLDIAEVHEGDERVDALLETLRQLGGIIRHELQPPIGWLRYAANQ